MHKPYLSVSRRVAPSSPSLYSLYARNGLKGQVSPVVQVFDWTPCTSALGSTVSAIAVLHSELDSIRGSRDETQPQEDKNAIQLRTASLDTTSDK